MGRVRWNDDGLPWTCRQPDLVQFDPDLPGLDENDLFIFMKCRGTATSGATVLDSTLSAVDPCSCPAIHLPVIPARMGNSGSTA